MKFRKSKVGNNNIKRLKGKKVSSWQSELTKGLTQLMKGTNKVIKWMERDFLCQKIKLKSQILWFSGVWPNNVN